MMHEFSWATIVLCSVIALLAGTMTGFSGFGFALIAVPLLTLFVDIKLVVPLVLLLSLFSVVVLSANKLRFFREPTIYSIFGGMMLGIWIGTHFLAHFDTAILKKLLGVVVILFAAHIFVRVRRERDPNGRDAGGAFTRMLVAAVVGLLSGVAGGLFGTSGPPLVIYVDYFAKDKTAFRSQLLVLFVLHDLFRMFLYVYYSLMNREIATFGAFLLPAVAIGLLLGSRMHFQVNEKTFSRAVAVMLSVSGILLLIR